MTGAAGPRPGCAVIIPTHNGAALTTACVDGLLRLEPERATQRIVVVDDGSDEPLDASLARFGERVQLVRLAANRGFAGACNAGAAAAGDCEHLVFLNNDTLPTRGWLDALAQDAQSDPRTGAVGARLLFPNGQVQHAGIAIGQDLRPHNLYAGFPASHAAVLRPREVAAVTAACMLVPRTVFEALGGFDPAFHNGFEDVDLCLRMRERGLTVRYCPASVVYHLESVTRWPDGTPVGVEQASRAFDERWRERLQADDLEHYLRDGLISLDYGSHYPLRIAVSPELAVRAEGSAGFCELDRALAARSEQVMSLLARETRRSLRARASVQTLASALSPAGEAEPALIARGRPRALGRGGRLISVLLPVKNGASELRALLPRVLSQSISARIEIVAVDSGSQDDSVQVLRRHGATVLSIPPSRFDHGLTRNLAASHAGGDVLVLLTQRALPADDRWLAPLVGALDADPEVVGACSRVLPRQDADLLTRLDAERELSSSPARRRAQITDWPAYAALTDDARRAFLNFHTVSAAIRAEAWRRTPFRSVRTIGEDLLWAREVLEDGWALVHEPGSRVLHSHDYSLAELLARNVDDGVAVHDISGRELRSDQLAEQITALALDDWERIRAGTDAQGEELDRLQIQAVLRRAAQAVGQWLGVNCDRLAPGTAAQFSAVARARADAGSFDPGAPLPAAPWPSL